MVPDTAWERRRKAEPEQTGMPAWLRALREFGRLLATALQASAYVLGAALVLFLAVLLYRRRRNWLGGPRAAPLPETLFGLDVRPESLPDDVAAAARALLGAGDAVGSLSLLYRGTLSMLLHRRRIDFRHGDTEADCLGRARSRVEPPVYGYFSQLLDAWRLAAYAHQPPSNADIVRLCDGWAAQFGSAS